MTTTGAVDGVWLIRGTRTLRALHALLALAALVGVGIELATASTGGPGMADSRAERLVRLFSFFTIQSNLVVALAGILIAVAPLRVGRVRAVIHLDALLCITVTGIVYHTLLAGDSGALTPSGWLANFLLHTVTPVGAWLVWLAVGPRPRFSGATVLWAVAYPLAWIAYTFVRGGITGWYPYPFLDAGEIGLGAATRNTALVAVGFLLLAALVRLLERVLPAAPRAVPETPADDGVAGTPRTLTITAEVQDALRRDAGRALETRALRLIGILLVLGGVAPVLHSALTGDEGDWLPTAAALLVVIGSLLGMRLLQRRRLRAAIDHAFPVGSVASAALAEDGLHLSSAVSSATTAYREFRSVERVGSVVVLRPVKGAMQHVHLGDLFDDADLEELRRRFALGR
jgi:hypothetical protein